MGDGPLHDKFEDAFRVAQHDHGLLVAAVARHAEVGRALDRALRPAGPECRALWLKRLNCDSQAEGSGECEGTESTVGVGAGAIADGRGDAAIGRALTLVLRGALKAARRVRTGG